MPGKRHGVKHIKIRGWISKRHRKTIQNTFKRPKKVKEEEKNRSQKGKNELSKSWIAIPDS